MKFKCAVKFDFSSTDNYYVSKYINAISDDKYNALAETLSLPRLHDTFEISADIPENHDPYDYINEEIKKKYGWPVSSIAFDII